jgi:hypothetical protein
VTVIDYTAQRFRYMFELTPGTILAHEIKGLQALIECNIPNLHFPLQINVDYLGRRLSASTLLPIGSDTLIYGSADGGKSIVESSAEMKSIMRSISEKLHLKPHPVGAPEVRPSCVPSFLSSFLHVPG